RITVTVMYNIRIRLQSFRNPPFFLPHFYHPTPLALLGVIISKSFNMCSGTNIRLTVAYNCSTGGADLLFLPMISYVFPLTKVGLFFIAPEKIS
ncbi:MAG: hypothetical protein LBC40_03950, partial [Dysgonamonadaceae bacterium]|nr:hypothetical protein [Dysgonamonadaceae bacterium]